ncbi:MAG TPA: hypothetical protein ENJ08_04130 [Gammaproteobacteria bacterium]|nr:hypothetical protein [Gammaproteobacteria bacterium]
MERYFRIASCLLGRAGRYMLLMALPGSLLAAQWTVTPSARIEQSYNDNIYLSNLTSPSVATRTINPGIDFGWATKRANISLLGDWKYRQYTGDLKLKNRTDTRYQLKSGYKTERSEFSLTGSSVKNTTLNQERYSEDTGVTLAQLDRQTMQIAPTWSWMLNERSNLRIDLQYQDVVYEKRSISPYNDYRYDSAGLTYTFRWTMRDQMYAVVEQSRYDSRKRALIPAYEMVSASKYLGSSSDTITYQIGMNHQFSSTFKVGLGYGRRDSETQTQYQNCVQINFYTLTCVATNETQSRSITTSPVYTVSADKDFELTKLGIKLSRTISASGLGSEMQVDSLDMTISQHINEKFNLKLKGIVNQRLAVNPNFNSYDRKYLRGEASLGWKLDENWNFYMTYRYVRQIYKSSDAIAVSNNISLNVRYAWDRISVSR